MPIDHASIIVPMAKVDDYADFLKAALAPIGYKEWMRPVKWAVGLGDTTPNFWINGVEAKGMSEDAIVEMVNGQHFAFLAESESHQAEDTYTQNPLLTKPAQVANKCSNSTRRPSRLGRPTMERRAQGHSSGQSTSPRLSRIPSAATTSRCCAGIEKRLWC